MQNIWNEEVMTQWVFYPRALGLQETIFLLTAAVTFQPDVCA